MKPSQPLTDTFKLDCIVWVLFAGKNLSAGADGLHWKDRDWSLVNDFIAFTDAEVGASGRFESDFMVRHMRGTAFSPEASAASLKSEPTPLIPSEVEGPYSSEAENLQTWEPRLRSAQVPRLRSG